MSVLKITEQRSPDAEKCIGDFSLNNFTVAENGDVLLEGQKFFIVSEKMKVEKIYEKELSVKLSWKKSDALVNLVRDLTNMFMTGRPEMYPPVLSYDTNFLYCTVAPGAKLWVGKNKPPEALAELKPGDVIEAIIILKAPVRDNRVHLAPCIGDIKRPSCNKAENLKLTQTSLVNHLHEEPIMVIAHHETNADMDEAEFLDDTKSVF